MAHYAIQRLESLAIYKTIKNLTLDTNLNSILFMSSRSHGCEEFLTVSA